MNDKQKLARLKKDEKVQKNFIKGLRKEVKATISKLKKSCQSKTKKYNEKMKTLRSKTEKLKEEKKALDLCERNLESETYKFKREISEHVHDLEDIKDEILKLKKK
jgi:dGTP triphosphohydrolase